MFEIFSKIFSRFKNFIVIHKKALTDSRTGNVILTGVSSPETTVFPTPTDTTGVFMKESLVSDLLTWLALAAATFSVFVTKNCR